MISTSTGDSGGKWTWTGTATSPQGTLQLRDFEQRDAKQLKLWGEALLGGTWQKSYEVSCQEVRSHEPAGERALRPVRDEVTGRSTPRPRAAELSGSRADS